MIDGRFDAETERLLKLIRTALRILDLSNREVERRIGMSPSYLSRLFSGAIELKVEHLLAICEAVGLHPAELFRLAYPEVPEPPSEAAAALLEAAQPFRPPEPAPGRHDGGSPGFHALPAQEDRSG